MIFFRLYILLKHCICQLFNWDRIQKDLIDPEKLQAILGDETLGKTSNLKRALEMVALLEAQLKDMNPNLESISEYARVSGDL